MNADALRLILLVVGLGVVLAIYLAGRTKERRAQKDLHSEFDRYGDDLAHFDPVDLRLDDVLENVIPEVQIRIDDERAPDMAPEQNADSEQEEVPSAPAEAQQSPSSESEPQAVSPPERLVVFHVRANTSGFLQRELMPALQEQRLEYGQFGIFHRLAVGDSRPIYSVASMVKPGVLDPENDDFSTPGLTLFCQIPGPVAPLEALDMVHRAAKALASTLGGVVLDDRRDVLTAQKLEYIRVGLQEYQRKSKINKV